MTERENEVVDDSDADAEGTVNRYRFVREALVLAARYMPPVDPTDVRLYGAELDTPRKMSLPKFTVTPS